MYVPVSVARCDNPARQSGKLLTQHISGIEAGVFMTDIYAFQACMLSILIACMCNYPALI